MAPPSLNAVLTDLSRNAWALSAIAVAAERGILAALATGPQTVPELARRTKLQPPTVSAIADLLASLQLATRVDQTITASAELAAAGAGMGAQLVAADICSTLGALANAASASREPERAVEGWAPTDPAVVKAQALLSGVTSEKVAGALQKIPPIHAALSAPGASFLDMGAGGGGLCIAFARAVPGLRLVGIEPSAVAISEARRAVAEAGLAERIELRESFGEALTDESVFAAAYVAQMFIPDVAIEGVFRATARSLVDNGVMFTGAVVLPGDDLAAAVSRYRGAVWGGGARSVEAVIRLIEASGFTGVQTMPAQGFLTPLTARRA